MALPGETGDNREMRLACVVAILACAVSPAHADVLVLYGDVQGGGMFGRGTGGDQQESAFFENAPNGAYGVRVGARLLFLGAAIEHTQYTDGSTLATWSQIAAGLDVEVGLGSDKEKKEHRGGFVDVAAMLGYGVGTGQQVMPPLSYDELTDQGFLIQGRFAYGKHLNRLIDLGVAVPVSWGYFFKSGVDNPANSVTNHYQSMQIEALLFLRLAIRLL